MGTRQASTTVASSTAPAATKDSGSVVGAVSEQPPGTAPHRLGQEAAGAVSMTACTADANRDQ